jgi:hypothetical protein
MHCCTGEHFFLSFTVPKLLVLRYNILKLQTHVVSMSWDVIEFALLRIRDVYPGSRVKKIPDPGSASKNLSILALKIVFKLSENDLGCHPGYRFFPSRIQGSKRHRIPDPDPQH